MGRKVKIILIVFTVILLAIMLMIDQQRIADSAQHVESAKNEKEINASIKPIDNESGLIIAPGLALVKTNCLRCHSGKIIAQNRGSRENWLATIRWMQETQNLWNLGDQEELILDYLSQNYAPQQVGRRKNLSSIEWYELKEEQ